MGNHIKRDLPVNKILYFHIFWIVWFNIHHRGNTNYLVTLVLVWWMCEQIGDGFRDESLCGLLGEEDFPSLSGSLSDLIIKFTQDKQGKANLILYIQEPIKIWDSKKWPNRQILYLLRQRNNTLMKNWQDKGVCPWHSKFMKK